MTSHLFKILSVIAPGNKYWFASVHKLLVLTRHICEPTSIHTLSFQVPCRCQRWPAAFTAILLAIGLMLIATDSYATFPGKNGRIVYRANANQLYLTESGQLTFPDSGIYDFAPAFSPDSSKIAFFRQSVFSPGSYYYRLMVVNKDGTGLRSVVTSDSFPGLTSFGSLGDPTWSSDGTRISFAVRNGGAPGAQHGIWTVSVSGGGLTHTVQENWVTGLNRSPVSQEIVYICSFRKDTNDLNQMDLCVYDEIRASVRQIPVDWPGRGTNTLSGPKWLPDGEKIVFTVGYATFGSASHFVEHVDIFSVNANGRGLSMLTDSGPDICPNFPVNLTGESPATHSYESPTPSPDGSSMVVFRQTWYTERSDCLATDGSYSLGFRSRDQGIYVMNINGGTAAPVLLSPRPAAGMDWEPLPADLTVKVDDGHGDPLDGLKVQIRNKDTSAILYENPVHNGDGTYLFEDVPAGDYVVRTTLIDVSDGPGSTPAFEIIHQPESSEAAWAEYSVTVPATGGKIARLPFEEQIFVPTNVEPLIASSVDQTDWDRLDDLAVIYYNLQRYVAWVKRTIQPTTGATVSVHAFATVKPGTSEPFYSPEGAYYLGGAQPTITLGTAFSLYKFRDGVYGDDYGDEAPENGEWHEFNHHLWFTFVDTAAACVGENHGGYKNANTCDSMFEGFAMFLAAAAARDIDGVTDSFYDGVWDLEAPLKAWSSYTSDGEQVYEEDAAVATLLWDLYDDAADRLDTGIIAESGSHQPATYTDEASESVVDLWTRFKTFKPLTVDELRLSYGAPDLSIDLDDDGWDDIAPIDQVFLMHGFFPIDVDETIASAHKTYHYDVNYAQRGGVTNTARNAVVGWSSHRMFSANGTVLDELIPRSHTPTNPSANVAIDILASTGNPLSGAEVDVEIEYPGQQRSTSSRRLDTGVANLVSLRLPSYFDYLLPADAPLPDCDPTNDMRTVVTIHARVNGYESTDSPSFDNCTYQRAVAAATGTAGLSFTASFPPDSTPPESTVDTVPTGALVGGSTQGFWIVRLVCDDPADSGFAAGCMRTEYRLDGGPVNEYQRSVRVADVGAHAFEYRSVDAAGNEETWRSVALENVVIPPTVDGFTPSSGVIGSWVEVTGTNFIGTTGVAFSGTSASFTIDSATKLTATVPAGATTGPISVTAPSGTATSSASFTTILPPVITGITPAFGKVGNVVTITGSNFTGTTRVEYTGAIAGFRVDSATQITTIVPDGAVTGPIWIETPGGSTTSSAIFTVTTGTPPSITSYTPTSGAIGATVTIKGSALANATSVTFNGVNATFNYKRTSIIAAVPSGATTGPIRVTTAGGTATTANFVVNLSPAISGLSPTSGRVGSIVTLTGSNLNGATAVKIGGGSATYTVVSPTTITATVPRNAKSGAVTVTTPGGTATSPMSFTVVK